jgi:hypothetical protein
MMTRIFVTIDWRSNQLRFRTTVTSDIAEFPDLAIWCFASRCCAETLDAGT